MYKTSQEAKKLITELLPLIASSEVEVAVFPPFTSLETVVGQATGTNLGVGAQDVFWEEEGAYTGEISPVMLKALGCSYSLVGHSERRQYFGETEATVNKKIKALLKHQLTPILCVGETLEQRETGITQEVIGIQVRQGLAGLSSQEVEGLIIAYEPVWAIGTGKTATAQQAQEVIGYIRGLLSKDFGEETAQKVRILYGGSVKPGNIKELMEQPDLDGALVGGASLKAEDFAAIVNYNS